MSLTITEMAQGAFTNAKAKGFHDKPREFSTAIALCHSELSEAMEADRNFKDYLNQAAKECDVLWYAISNTLTGATEWRPYEGAFNMQSDELLCGVRCELKSGKTVLIPAQLFFQEAKILQKNHIAEELADVLIRIGDMAVEFALNLEYAVQKKMEKNAGRPFMHGGKGY